MVMSTRTPSWHVGRRSTAQYPAAVQLDLGGRTPGLSVAASPGTTPLPPQCARLRGWHC